MLLVLQRARGRVIFYFQGNGENKELIYLWGLKGKGKIKTGGKLKPVAFKL